MNSTSHSPAAIEFIGVGFRAPTGQPILSSLDLVVRQGETLVFLGRSGSGKTTALKLINRLEAPSEGEVRVEGRSTLAWDEIALRRRIGYVIQEVGLFPHFTVARNIALPPRLAGWPEQKVGARVDSLLELVGLDPETFRHRLPRELSGGQRQRVGVARALAADPPILLLDEPFGALDPLTRADLQREFRGLERRLGKTVVFVTHDLNEAMRLATRIALLEEGRLAGVYSPEEFLRSPDRVVAAYVAAFRGEGEQ
jgi:osmoprotectant transport system ATP-binding protein